MISLRNFVLGAGLAALSTVPALASTHTASVTINGSVSQSCQAFTPSTAQSITFGAYDSFANATADLDDTTGVTLTTHCTKGATVNFSVDGGANYASTPVTGTRALKDANNNYLAYNLYRESSHTNVWGFDSTGAGTNVSAGTIASSADNQSISLYGRVPHGQDPAVSSTYGDTVTVTVSF
jgi:spore coat protein U-like protein